MERAAAAVIVVALACLARLPTALEGLSCPASCEDVSCQTDLTQADCDQLNSAPGAPSGYYYGLLNDASLCGCCPGCYRFSKQGTACSKTQKCKPGLKCSTKSLCIVDKKSCNYRLTLDDVAWKPSCDLDGVFSSKICKGEQPTGRCFCNNSTGDRIFGQEWWTKAENMTCACSRRVSELQASGRRNVTLHCDQSGSYEPLQCDSGMCWCAAPKTGQPTSRVVPAILMPQLPCYNATAVGSQYLRQCESQYIAVENIREELQYHGTTKDNMFGLNCDRDGSYGSVQVSSNLAYCKSRNNTALSGQDKATNINLLDCNCARDKLFYPESGMGTLSLTCSTNGSYSTAQHDNQQQGFCVDSDGYITKTFDESDYINYEYYQTELC